MQEIPNIRSSYEMKREYVPLTEREEVEDFDEILDQRRLAHRDINKEIEEIDECTFEPAKLSKNKNMSRSIDDLYMWNDQKRRRIEHERLKGVVNMPQYRFEPKIDKNSVEILERKKDSYLARKPEDRLLERGEDIKRKKERLRESSTKGWFKPHITQRSKEIVARKTGKLPPESKVRLKKLGRTKNVTYYDASHGPSKPKTARTKRVRNTAGLRKKKKSDNPVKSRQIRAIEKSKERIQTARAERDRIRNPKFKKITDPLPDYKSPYNRDIVQSEIPINKLIDKKTHKRLKKMGRPSIKKRRKGQ